MFDATPFSFTLTWPCYRPSSRVRGPCFVNIHVKLQMDPRLKQKGTDCNSAEGINGSHTDSIFWSATVRKSRFSTIADMIFIIDSPQYSVFELLWTLTPGTLQVMKV